MARKAKAKPVREPVREYNVLADRVTPDITHIGPYPVVSSGDKRVVRLTPREAQHYIEQGAIEPE